MNDVGFKSTWDQHTSLSQEMKVHLADALDGWTLTGDGDTFFLRRAFRFKDFEAGAEFVNEIVAVAKKQGHCPEIWLGGGGEVKVIAMTDNNMTMSDYLLAKEIDLIPIDEEKIGTQKSPTEELIGNAEERVPR
tara:strand:+ start:2229 stop:2630 length:402 start_codon:yes stop_codon:yes gene_type:complete